MNTARQLTKAKLIEIAWNSSGQAEPVPGGIRVTVQFNPASLKVNYANQVQTNDQSSSSAIQYVGQGTSKLSLELIFDVSMPLGEPNAPPPNDVRALTDQVARLMKPTPEGQGERSRYAPPGVRFSWGSFLFDGIVESLDETLDLWSEDGRPLRATVSLSLAQQGIFVREATNPDATAPPQAPGAAPTGAIPLSLARLGDTVQSLAARAGRLADWKQIAAANGIENPRALSPGLPLDLTRR
ncbi:MAG TPA: LysM peptidoglycan-binding domain-containing protein [Caldilineaceae bacterium]|nr:LysM peptidoglycan-binding domain-containing protein [Caldilineaceae bacterium]